MFYRAFPKGPICLDSRLLLSPKLRDQLYKITSNCKVGERTADEPPEWPWNWGMLSRGDECSEDDRIQHEASDFLIAVAGSNLVRMMCVMGKQIA